MSGAKTIITDTKDRKWEIACNYSTLGKVKTHLGFDLLLELLPDKPGTVDYENVSLDELPLISRLQVDDILFVNVLFCLCMEQADSMGIQDSDFGASLDPDVVTKAKEIFWKELESFFQSMGKGKAPCVLAIQQLRKATTQYQALEEELEPRLQQIVPQADQAMEEAMQKVRKDLEASISGNLDTRLSAASESIP